MASLFKRGYKAVEEEKQRQEEEKEKRQNRVFRFFLQGDGSEADLRFLTEEPITFYEHTIKKTVNGKERYDSVVCSGDNCPECAKNSRPTFKGAYLVVDRRPFEYTDSNGKKVKGKNQLRLFVQGQKVLSQLDRISQRYGLSNRDVTIIRLGTGTQTSYTIERGEKEELSQKEIEAFLPDFMKEQFDGTMSSLEDIIEKQLEADLPKETHSNSDDEDEEDDDLPKSNGLVNIDNEEEEEEEKPKRSKLKLGGKRRENSLKKLLKSSK